MVVVDLGSCDRVFVDNHRTKVSIRPSARTLAAGYTMKDHTAVVVGKYIYVEGVSKRDWRGGFGVCFIDTTTWEWDVWSTENDLISAEEWLPKMNPVLVKDKVHSFMVYENLSSKIVYSHMYEMDLTMRSRAMYPCVTGAELLPVSESKAVYLEKAELIIAFGGRNLKARSLTNKLVGYSVDSNKWIELQAKGRPPCSRGFHACCTNGDSDVYISGGIGYPADSEYKAYLGDIYRLSYQGFFTWSKIEWETPKRCFHSMNAIGSRLFILGGYEKYQSQLYRYDTTHGVPERDFLVYDVAKKAGIHLDGSPNSLGVTQDHSLKLRIQGKVPAMAGHATVNSSEAIYILQGHEHQKTNDVLVLSV